MTLRTRLLALTLALASLAAAGCSGVIRYALLGTREYATTEGEARLVERDDGRYDLEVTVDRLPSLESLGEGLTSYVVWIQPEGEEHATRVGVLTIDAGGRTGHATAITGAGRMSLHVTAEASAEVEQPSERVLIATILEPAH